MYIDLLIALGATVVATVAYLLLRRFIAWAIQDDNNWHKKRGNLGLHEDTLKTNTKIALDKLTQGYLLVLFVIGLYIVAVIVDTM